jgi:hypothetical protein
VYSLFTRYEWGVFKVIPFEVHLLFDVILGAKLLVAAWLFDSLTAHPRAIGTLTGFGVASLVLACFSRRYSFNTPRLERTTAHEQI